MGWLRAQGRLSYEIDLAHLFVVFGLVRSCRLADGDPRWGFLRYLLVLPLCWLAGWRGGGALAVTALRSLAARKAAAKKRYNGFPAVVAVDCCLGDKAQAQSDLGNFGVAERSADCTGWAMAMSWLKECVAWPIT